MSTPEKRSGGPTDLSSSVEPIPDSTPAIEEPSEQQNQEAVRPVREDPNSQGFDQNGFGGSDSDGPSWPPFPFGQRQRSLRATERRSTKINWLVPTLALAFIGLVYVALSDLRAPWASAESLSMPQKRGDQENHEFANLIVTEATPRPMDQPVPLGVSVDNSNDFNVLKVSGLPKGTTLSTGVAAGDDRWVLDAADSKDAVIRPPPRFVGVMALTVSLMFGSGINGSESRSLRFEWVAEKDAEVKLSEEAPPAAQVQDEAPAAARVQDEAPVAARVQDEAPALETVRDEAPPAAQVQEALAVANVPDKEPPAVKVQDEAPAAAKSGTQRIPQASAAEMAALLKRANELVSSGDLAAARLVLRRAAEDGDARAAFALAGTYNPITLAKLQVHGLSPDLAMARYWYEKARELGSPDASRELQILTVRRN